MAGRVQEGWGFGGLFVSLSRSEVLSSPFLSSGGGDGGVVAMMMAVVRRRNGDDWGVWWRSRRRLAVAAAAARGVWVRRRLGGGVRV